MKKIITAILAILLPLMSVAQKGRHFEFNYLALELGSTHCFNAQPEPCMNYYYHSSEGKMHLIPVQGTYYTPGYNLGLQFHHDLLNDRNGIVIGAVAHSWGNTAKYQSVNKKVTLTETQRVMSIGVPVYFKIGQQIYNQQCYMFLGTQVDFNIGLRTVQKQNTSGTETHRTDAYKDGLNKINIPVIVGFNYGIINIKFGLQTKGFLNPDYEMAVGDGQIIKPFEGNSKISAFANFGLLIPLSQWTLKRSYLLSRIF